MNSSETALYSQSYKSVERPFANVDLSKVPWEIVIKIMEQQAQMVRNASEQHIPQPISSFEYHTSPFNYSQNTSVEESDHSSCFSEDMSSSPAETSQSDDSQSESDIDVDSVEEESDDFFMSSIDNIPITVLQLETKLREKEQQQQK